MVTQHEVVLGSRKTMLLTGTALLWRSVTQNYGN